jgi:hypothetical protein
VAQSRLRYEDSETFFREESDDDDLLSSAEAAADSGLRRSQNDDKLWVYEALGIKMPCATAVS